MSESTSIISEHNILSSSFKISVSGSLFADFSCILGWEKVVMMSTFKKEKEPNELFIL